MTIDVISKIASSIIEIENMKNEFFATYLKDRIVSKEELEQNKHKKKDGTFSNYYKDYLEKHGIKKDSAEAKTFVAFYNTKLNKGQKMFIEETLYEIQSYSDGTEKHNTYYILHPVQSN